MYATLQSKSQGRQRKKREPGVKTILKQTYTQEDKKIKKTKRKLPQMYGSVNEYLQHKMKVAQQLAAHLSIKKTQKTQKDLEPKKRKEVSSREKMVFDMQFNKLDQKERQKFEELDNFTTDGDTSF